MADPHSISPPVSPPSPAINYPPKSSTGPPSQAQPKPPLSRVPSYLTATPRRAIASFENLVALANYEEHLREARKMVWRDRGQPAVELHDLAECADHGLMGGMRA